MNLGASTYKLGDSVRLTNGTVAVIACVRVSVSKDGRFEQYGFQMGRRFEMFELAEVVCKVKVNDQIPPG